MSYREEAVAFMCEGESLVGILSSPQSGCARDCHVLPSTAASIGVVIIVGGPQYRAGSHRQFTLLARALAEAGYPTLRFDYRGMGDSTGAQRTFDAVHDDVSAAIGALVRHQPTVGRVILWGLCDGASAALLYLHATRDARVSGLALLNPWVRTEAGLARVHLKHYYLHRLFEREFWNKALRGQVAGKAVSDLWRNLKGSSLGAKWNGSCATKPDLAPYQQRMADVADRFGGPLLLVTSGNDLTAKEFIEYMRRDVRWQRVMARSECVRVEIEGADHTFSSRVSSENLMREVVRWIMDMGGTSVGNR